MDSNCSGSDSIPESEEFLSKLTDAEISLVIVCGVLTLISVCIFIDNIIFICRKHTVLKKAVITSTWLVGLTPTLSLIALTAMLVPHIFLFRDVMVSVCLSIVMYKFVQLLATYVKHFDDVRDQIVTKSKIRFNVRPLCCCCVCLPTAEVKRSNVQILKTLVLQYPFVAILLTVITMVTWLDGKYVTGKWSPENPYPYLAVARILSVLTALYSLNILVTLCVDAMKSFYVKQKFLALTLCITFSSLQGLIFDILIRSGVFDYTDRFSGSVMGSFYENITYCIEMFLLTVLNLWSYRRLLGPPVDMNKLEKASAPHEVTTKNLNYQPAEQQSQNINGTNSFIIDMDDTQWSYGDSLQMQNKESYQTRSESDSDIERKSRSEGQFKPDHQNHVQYCVSCGHPLSENSARTNTHSISIREEIVPPKLCNSRATAKTTTTTSTTTTAIAVVSTSALNNFDDHTNHGFVDHELNLDSEISVNVRL